MPNDQIPRLGILVPQPATAHRDRLGARAALTRLGLRQVQPDAPKLVVLARDRRSRRGRDRARLVRPDERKGRARCRGLRDGPHRGVGLGARRGDRGGRVDGGDGRRGDAGGVVAGLWRIGESESALRMAPRATHRRSLAYLDAPVRSGPGHPHAAARHARTRPDRDPRRHIAIVAGDVVPQRRRRGRVGELGAKILAKVGWRRSAGSGVRERRRETHCIAKHLVRVGRVIAGGSSSARRAGSSDRCG